MGSDIFAEVLEGVCSKGETAIKAMERSANFRDEATKGRSSVRAEEEHPRPLPM